MPRPRRALLVALAALAPAGAALAASKPAPFGPDAAMRKGIRTWAQDSGATASRLHVSCAAIPKVGQTRPCTGTFRLTRHGRHADYRLTSRASTFRNSAHSIMYHVAARTTAPLPGVPSSTGGFSGFLQDGSGKP